MGCFFVLSDYYYYKSSCYDFEQLSAMLHAKYPNTELVGCSTSGEISEKGFTKNSIVMTGMIDSSVKVKGVLIEDGDKFPMVHKEQLEAAMSACDINRNDARSHNNAFAMTFINGLCNAEEAILSALHYIIGNRHFRVIGGSAGDDLKFDTTYTSLNGQVCTNGGVVVFVKTNKKYVIKKENIFKPSNKQLKLTKVDTEKRIIYEIDSEPAAKAYAKSLGIGVDKIMDVSLAYPIGRAFGDDIYISSIAGVNPDGSFNMYCRVLPNTTVELMELDDIHGLMDATITKIEQEIPKPGFVFFVNCILRTLQFDGTQDGNYLVSQYKKHFNKVVGFSSYGEQINRVNSNQTLVVLAMEE